MEAEDILIRLLVDKHITNEEFKVLWKKLETPQTIISDGPVDWKWRGNDPNNPHFKLLSKVK